VRVRARRARRFARVDLARTRECSGRASDQSATKGPTGVTAPTIALPKWFVTFSGSATPIGDTREAPRISYLLPATTLCASAIAASIPCGSVT
jgi:hypothetical protein